MSGLCFYRSRWVGNVLFSWNRKDGTISMSLLWQAGSIKAELCPSNQLRGYWLFRDFAILEFHASIWFAKRFPCIDVEVILWIGVSGKPKNNVRVQHRFVDKSVLLFGRMTSSMMEWFVRTTWLVWPVHFGIKFLLSILWCELWFCQLCQGNWISVISLFAGEGLDRRPWS